METTNFDQKDSNEEEIIIGEEAPVSSLEQREVGSTTENVANINIIEEKIIELEGEIKEHTDETNKVRADLGLAPETEIPPSLRAKISNLGKFKNYLKNTAKAVTMAGIMLAGNGEAVAQTNQTIDKNGDKIEMNDLEQTRKKNLDIWISKKYDLVQTGKLAPGTVLEGPDGNKYKIGAVLDNNLLKKNMDNESMDGPDNNTKKINISSFFKTGTVEYIDANSEEKAKQSIRDFLDSVNDLENSNIKVLGTYSVDRPWGEVSPENPHGDKNTEIAKDREKVGLALLKKVITEKYGAGYLENLDIDSEAKGVALSDKFSKEEIGSMTDLEKQKEIDLNQGMSLSVIKKIINKAEKMNTPSEVKEYLNAAVVILDRSASMDNDTKQALKIIEKINTNNNKKIKTLTLEGGNSEAHLQTLENLLSSLDESSMGKDIIVITDEPDNTLNNETYNQKIDQVLELAKIKKVNIVLKLFNPKTGEHPTNLASINVELNENNKNALRMVDHVPGMKYQTKAEKTQYWFDSQVNNSNITFNQ